MSNDTVRLVQPGNAKLGAVIGAVSLPAIQTCPSAGACAQVCYFVKLMQRFPSLDQYVQTNLQILDNDPDGYFAQLAHEIKTNGYATVRFHVGGDFYSTVQIQGWIQLASHFKSVQFFGYSRSWKSAELKPSLDTFRDMSNVQLFASVEPNEIAPDGYRTATIIPKHQVGVVKGATKCLESVGIKASCSECRFCIDSPKNKTVNVLFPKH